MTIRLHSGAFSLASGSCVAALVAIACGSFSASEPVGDPDGGSTSDAGNVPGAEGGSGADGTTAARYCDGRAGAAFCADFDGPTVLTEWDQQMETGAGVLSAISSERSAPNALHATTPAVIAGATPASALVAKRVQGDVATLSLAFDIGATKSCATNGDAVTYVEVITYASGGGTLANFSLLETKSGLKMFVKDGMNEYTDLTPLPNTREWTRVTVEAAGGMLTIAYDGQRAASPIPFTFTSASFDVRVGVNAGGPSAYTPCEAEYDNVVVRFAP
ncbi:MAG: hypothetical protein JWP87_2233 [Labilithrix sp.]|nr:hypothetical protein [Labilithrix sp.]